MSSNVADAPPSPSPSPSPPAGVEEVDTADLGFLSGLASAPCFRDTALYSIGGGATLAGLHLHRNRDVMRSAELMIKSGCAFATLHWMICRKRYYDEREMTYGAIQAQKARAMARRAEVVAAGHREQQGQQE